MSSELAIGVVIGASVRAGFATVFGRAKNTVKELGQEIQAVRGQQEKLGRSIAKGVATGRGGLGVLRERYDVLGRAIDKASAAQTRLNKAIKSQERAKDFRKELRSEIMETAGHAAVVAGPVIASVKKFMEQENASADLKISMMRKDGSFGKFTEIDRLTTQLGAALPGNKTDFSKMALGLKSQGISDDTILNGGGLATAQLNVVMDIPIADGSFFAKNMEAHGIKESELLKSADLTQRAYFAAGLKKEDMFEAMKYYAPKVNTLGLTGLENQKQIYAVEGLSAQKGLEGSSFGTNFSMMLSRLEKGPKLIEMAKKGMKAEVRALMEESGAEFNFFNSDGSMKSLRSITADLEKGYNQIRAKFGDQGVVAVFDELFDQQGGRVASIMAQAGVKGFDEMIEKMDAQASLSDRIKVKTSTLSSALEALGGAAENAAAVFGSVFGQDIKSAAQTLQGFVENDLQPFLEKNKDIIKWGVGLAAGFFAAKLGLLGLAYGASMALMPFRAVWTAGMKASAAFRLFQLMRLGNVGKGVMLLRMLGMSARGAAGAAAFFGRAFSLVSGGVLKVVRILPLLQAGLFKLGAFMLANPIFLALGLLAAAAYLLYRNWDGVVGGAKALWQDLGTLVGNVAGSVSDFFRTAWENIKAFFTSGIGNISAVILNWSPIGLFYSAFAAVMSWFDVELPAKFTGFGQMLIDGLANGIKSRVESVVAVVGGVVSRIKSAFTAPTQIRSPSRLFMRYGGWITEGLNIGISRGAARPIGAVGAWAGRMRDGFAERMGNLRSNIAARIGVAADAARNGVSGNITVHFNPTINAPGGDTEQIQTALALSQREFEAMFRRMMADKARRAY